MKRPDRRPYKGMTMFSEKEGFARPAQEANRASWFLRAMPLLPGRALLDIPCIKADWKKMRGLVRGLPPQKL
jgi:hypothetical protein